MDKIKIDIEEMAGSCGITFIRCGSDWGGIWGFSRVLDNGSTYTVNGFKTKKTAMKRWVENEFSSGVGKYLLEKYFTV